MKAGKMEACPVIHRVCCTLSFVICNWEASKYQLQSTNYFTQYEIVATDQAEFGAAQGRPVYLLGAFFINLF